LVAGAAVDGFEAVAVGLGVAGLLAAAGTVMAAAHSGHFVFLPARESATVKRFPHLQAKVMGIANSRR